MRIFKKRQILIVFLFFCFLGSGPFYAVANQPKSLIGKAFFYRDIARFIAPFAKKNHILKNQVITQPFKSKCSNLNRIILPFFITEKNGSGILTFNLYQNSKEKKLVFSTSINIEDFPSPKKMGTQEVDGVFYYIWIPPQPDSRNKQYLWELEAVTINNKVRIGLYMNHRSDSQIQPVVIDGVSKHNTYSAFYSYCQFRFEWNEIIKSTWDRFKREKIFLLFYLSLIVGIVLGIRLSKNENVDI